MLELVQTGRGRERWIMRRRVMKRRPFLLLAKSVVSADKPSKTKLFSGISVE